MTNLFFLLYHSFLDRGKSLISVNILKGDVTPQVSVIESTNVQALESAPGDFTVTAESGEQELLQTYGKPL